ncbi:hypothetical protein Dsin_005585, partial [Dipteronia sinensis]
NKKNNKKWAGSSDMLASSLTSSLPSWHACLTTLISTKIDIDGTVITTGGRNRGRVGTIKYWRDRRAASKPSTFKMQQDSRLQLN